MTPTLLTLALAAAPGYGPTGKYPLAPVTVPPDAPFGYTYRPARDLEAVPRYPACRYDPQPGDVILMSDPDPLFTILYTLALTGPPGHGGLVVRMPDGRLGLHEAGFNESLWNRVTPLEYRLTQYPGRVWVRRRRVPLTPEQDARLTEFAMLTADRRYNLHGFKLQITPFSARGPLRTLVLGRPHGPEARLFCSQAILEGLVYAGVIDGRTTRPAATFPRDLFFDRSLNPYINRHPPLAAGWEEPALWTPIVGLAMKGKERPAVEGGVVVPPPELPPPVPRRRLLRR